MVYINTVILKLIKSVDNITEGFSKVAIEQVVLVDRKRCPRLRF